MSLSYKAAEGFLFFFFSFPFWENLSFSIKRHIDSYLIAVVKLLGAGHEEGHRTPGELEEDTAPLKADRCQRSDHPAGVKPESPL